MIALVVLDPFEPDVFLVDELRAHHAQLLGSGERSDPGAQLDPPCRTEFVRRHRRHSMHEAHPRRVSVERGDLLEQLGCARVGERLGDPRLHRSGQRGRSAP